MVNTRGTIRSGDGRAITVRGPLRGNQCAAPRTTASSGSSTMRDRDAEAAVERRLQARGAGPASHRQHPVHLLRGPAPTGPTDPRQQAMVSSIAAGLRSVVSAESSCAQSTMDA